MEGTWSAIESLSHREHLRLTLLSGNDAVGQEIVWRGMFLHGLLATGMPSGVCNVIQAVSFGAAHWYGIPSGWSGMGLTFVFGWFMGWLVITQDGMAMALAVHWVADYFIYTSIARKSFK